MSSAERERLFEGILSDLADRGYDKMDLERTLAGAGVSMATFEAEFGDRDTCLFAAYDSLTERLVRRATEGCDPNADWPTRVRTGLEALLDDFAASPQMAQILFRSFPSIRPPAHLRYVEFLETFSLPLREGRALSGMEGEPPGEIEMLAIGAAETIVIEEIEAGRAAALPSLTPSILLSLLIPFLGPEQALAQAPGAVYPGDGARGPLIA
jgi:AcrR family transcriptional regulator